jgi:peptidoglycan LD-endopeptidase LytH
VSRVATWLASLLAATAGAVEVAWPTSAGRPHGQPYAAFIQPTVSGRLESGLFGMTRNDGTRFHEGVDIKPAFLNARGEAVDAVRAALAGRVAYVCDRVNGAYGRYVVLEHPKAELPVYTLYAHLASIRGDLAVGKEIPEGHVLGILGRSSEGIDPIPPERAHLHFEIGLRLSDRFDDWYAQSPHRREPNPHGNFNGMNLAGFDPLEPVLLRPRVDVHTVVNNLPAALVVVTRARHAPDFVRRHPQLATGSAQGSVGWRIEFTWHGLPKRWTPILQGSAGLPASGWRIERLSARPDLRRLLEQRQMIRPGTTEPGETLRRTMAILVPVN